MASENINVFWEKMVFEIDCLGCGNVAFTLPYRKGSHHTMTCQRCGEVTIAHVLPDEGGIALATLYQREKALAKLMDELEEFLKSFAMVIYYKGFEDWVITKKINLNWVKKTHLKTFEYIYRDNFCLLNTKVLIVINGLLASVNIQKNIHTDPTYRIELSEFDLSSFKNRLIVSHINQVKNVGK